MKRRIAALLLAAALLLSLSPAAFAAEDGYADSGFSTVSKLTKSEIARLLEDNPVIATRDVFLEEPRFTAPYYPGIVRDDALQAALDRLNAMRRLAGVPSVELADSMYAQHATVLNAIDPEGIYHGNFRPDDMDPDFFYIANTATLYANLVGGNSLTSAVDTFLMDLGAHNQERQGHRRDLLGPASLSAGFGYSYKKDSPAGSYVALMIGGSGNLSQAEAPTEYDFIAWPSSGNFPNTVFSPGVAWTVSVNPLYYADPDVNAVAVTLTRESDGKTWRFSGSGYKTGADGDYFNVDSTGTTYNSPSAIIFRPTLSEKTYEGVYTVEITGLKDKDGKDAGIQYQVDFFDPDTIARAFDDVSRSDWYYDAVMWGSGLGIVAGVGSGRFAPANDCTNVQILTFLWRAEGRPVATAKAPFVGDNADYQGAMDWACEKGMITDGFVPNAPCTRAAAMQYIWQAFGSDDSAPASGFTDVSAGAAYAKAVNWAVANGIAKGTGDNLFTPGMVCNRGTIITFLHRAYVPEAYA